MVVSAPCLETTFIASVLTTVVIACCEKNFPPSLTVNSCSRDFPKKIAAFPALLNPSLIFPFKTSSSLLVSFFFHFLVYIYLLIQ